MSFRLLVWLMLFNCWCFFLIPPSIGNTCANIPAKSTAAILYKCNTSNNVCNQLFTFSSTNSAEEEQEQEDSNSVLECKWASLSLNLTLTKSTINYHRYLKTEIIEFLEVCVPPPNA